MAEEEIDALTSITKPSSGINIKQFTSVPADDECYGTSNVGRGIALVFNHRKFKQQEEREETENDRNDIAQTLNDLKFVVRVYDDWTVSGVRTVLENVVRENHSKKDCLLVVVMSHGEQGTGNQGTGEQGSIYARDGYFRIEELWDNFVGDNCPSLIGKPKLFFIQSCQAYKETKSSLDDGEDEMDGKTAMGTPTVFFIPQLADLSIVFSTFEGFIQSLCKELKENSHTDSLQDLILGATWRVANEETEHIPTTLSTLTKRFYFPKNKTTCAPIIHK